MEKNHDRSLAAQWAAALLLIASTPQLAQALTIEEIQAQCLPRAESTGGSIEERERAYSGCVGANYWKTIDDECRGREAKVDRNTPDAEILARSNRIKRCESAFNAIPRQFVEARTREQESDLTRRAATQCEEKVRFVPPSVPGPERTKWYTACVEARSNGREAPERPGQPIVQAAKARAAAELQKPKCRDVTFIGPLLAAGNPIGLAMNAHILRDSEAFIAHRRNQPLQCTSRYCFGAGIARGFGRAQFVDDGVTVIEGVLTDDRGRNFDAAVAIRSNYVTCKSKTP